MGEGFIHVCTKILLLSFFERSLFVIRILGSIGDTLDALWKFGQHRPSWSSLGFPLDFRKVERGKNTFHSSYKTLVFLTIGFLFRLLNSLRGFRMRMSGEFSILNLWNGSEYSKLLSGLRRFWMRLSRELSINFSMPECLETEGMLWNEGWGLYL